MMTSQAITAVPAAQPMIRSDAVRLFAGFAGLGAAAVNLAISSSLFAAAGPAFPGRTAGAAAELLWGAALLAWTFAGLSKGRFPLPRSSALLLPASAAGHVAALVLGAGSGLAGLGISHLAALLLTLMIIAATSWLGRRPTALGRSSPGVAGGRARASGPVLPGGSGQNTAARLGAGRLLAAAFAGALLVAAVTTPGLAASTAGQYAVPHGEHTGGHHTP
jgi:hypothetical protein